MKREQIEKNYMKLEQLKEYERLKEKLIAGVGMWWAIITPKHTRDNGTHITDDNSRKRFMAWLENEIGILKNEIGLEDEK
ncbi:hypothetical protein KCG48_05095 [Proteiniclasticum sp. BAD-10]|uniref:Uncharacterized protein n=1 Tax=Proteiniclasticum sediminis TaxID=2804028 RepID=A0A941CP99_9CLOT|nr:hypothetical protein [Proteiniclasticum sediminis]MBR0575717.1 hypothetical protein [Proteiniclasticum sediminis]